MKYSVLFSALLLALNSCAQLPTTSQMPEKTFAVNASEMNNILKTYHWQLSKASNKRGKPIIALFVQADKPVQLDFKKNLLLVSNTCNNIMSSYTLDAKSLTFSPLAATQKLCVDNRLNSLDAEISKRFSGNTVAYRLIQAQPPILELTLQNGDRLTFESLPTAETRYGGKGEIVFLEVAPFTKPCIHPLMGKIQCLHVREIKYDEKGLKVGRPGKWQNIYQLIEGYTHEQGVRNVLKLKRYKINTPTTDSSSLAYVLDLIVEQEMVK